MCLSNKRTQFQTKGGITDGVLRVTYYDSRGFVSCNLIFHVADPTNSAIELLLTKSGRGIHTEHSNLMDLIHNDVTAIKNGR